jgi:glycosyltransferase involved in cell wall biosynthesis
MTDGLPARTTVVVTIWDEYVTAWLSDAVANLSAQEPAPRIIVVDNASTVALPKLPAIEVVRSARRLSRGGARDLGLAHVTTPYVVMWDADDVMPPGTLGFLEQAIAADSRLVAYGTAIVEHPTGRRHRWPRRWIGTLVMWPRAFAVLHAVWSIYPTTGSTIMRTDAVRAAGGYGDNDTGEDWLLGVSLAFRGRLGWSERTGRVYRLHDRSNWSRHATDVGYQMSHARAVRNRIRADRAIPAWVLPPIALGQVAAIIAHTAASATRGALRDSGLRP